jgi:hypothetical protein
VKFKKKKKTKVHKTPKPLKTTAFALKSKIILVISSCSGIEKTEKINQNKILLI